MKFVQTFVVEGPTSLRRLTAMDWPSATRHTGSGRCSRRLAEVSTHRSFQACCSVLRGLFFACLALIAAGLCLIATATCHAQAADTNGLEANARRPDVKAGIESDPSSNQRDAAKATQESQDIEAVESMGWRSSLNAPRALVDGAPSGFPGDASRLLGRAMLLAAVQEPSLNNDLAAIPPNVNLQDSEAFELLLTLIHENAPRVDIDDQDPRHRASDLYRLLNLTETLADLGLYTLARHGYAYLCTKSVVDDPRFSTYCCCRLASVMRRMKDQQGLESFAELLSERSTHNLEYVAAIVRAERCMSDNAHSEVVDVATQVLNQVARNSSKELDSKHSERSPKSFATFASSKLSIVNLSEVGHPTPARNLHPDIVLSAQLLLAEAHLRSNQPDRVLQVLDDLETPDATRQKEQALLLENLALLKQEPDESVLDALQQLSESSSVFSVREEASRTLAEHYLASEQFSDSLSFHRRLLQLNEARRAAEDVTIAESNDIVLRGQQELFNAQAMSFSEHSSRALDTQHRVDKLERDLTFSYFSVVAISTLLVGMIAFHWLDRRFRKEKEQRQLEQVNNRQLESLIEEKTEELRIEHEGRIQLERSLERKRRDESIGQLTGNVAHDFNNLLQVVISTNEFLKSSRDRLTQEEIELLETSTQSAQIGTSIVKQLLAYARQQKLTPAVMSVSDYLQGTESLLRAAVSSSCRLEIHDLTGNAKLQLDPVQLTTSLINLLSNAVDAMPAGGSIRLNARQVACDANELETWTSLNEQTYVAFDIIDQGCGISDEEKSRIFEPFYTTKQSSAGTGLGLSSVHGFVHQSGGDVKVFDHEHGGARVCMMFPVSEASTTEPINLFDSDHTKNGKVLVVEDNQLVGKSILRDIQHLGYHPTWAKSAMEAKDLILDGQVYDLIISDVRMPGDLSGVDLYDWVQENIPEVAFILMSGYSDLHPNDTTATFLQKPFTSLELTQAIRNEVAAANRRQTRDGKHIRFDAEETDQSESMTDAEKLLRNLQQQKNRQKERE